MVRIKYLSLSLVAAAALLLASCELLTSCFGGKKQWSNRIDYDIETLFDGYEEGVLLHNFYITIKSITHDDRYVYTATGGNSENPGKIIRLSKQDWSYDAVNLYDAAIKAGHTESSAYDIMSVSVYDDDLIVLAADNQYSVAGCVLELFCLDRKTLNIRWRWTSGAEEKASFWRELPTRWKDKYCYIYTVHEHDGGNFVLLVLDSDGTVLSQREFKHSRPSVMGELLINDDKLYLRECSRPIAIYDMQKVCDTECADDDCLLYHSELDFAYSFTNSIETDGNLYFHHSVEGDDFCVFAQDLHDNSIQWQQVLDSTFVNVHGKLLVHEGKLIVPADYGCVYCYDAKTGKPLWKTDVRYQIDAVNLMQAGCIVEKWLCIPCHSEEQILVINTETGVIDARIFAHINPTNHQCFSEDGYLYLTRDTEVYRIKFRER